MFKVIIIMAANIAISLNHFFFIAPGIFDEYPSYKITMSQGIPYLEVNFTVSKL